MGAVLEGTITHTAETRVGRETGKKKERKVYKMTLSPSLLSHLKKKKKVFQQYAFNKIDNIGGINKKCLHLQNNTASYHIRNGPPEIFRGGGFRGNITFNKYIHRATPLFWLKEGKEKDKRSVQKKASPFHRQTQEDTLTKKGG